MGRSAILVHALAAILFAAANATAQSYPAKSVRLVLGFSAGGSSDILARVFAQKFPDVAGQSILIDNRPGAGGNIAAELVAHAAADGYTLLLANQGILATNASLYPKIGFDALKDFAPVVLVASQPNILVVHPSLPVTTVREFVQFARARPDALNYASSGSGAGTHLAAELFKNMTGVRMTHIPYKGAPPALVDVIAGQVQVMFASVTSVKQQVEGKRLRALGVTGLKRLATLPQLPTVAESGVPGYEASAWHAFVAPARTPETVIGWLNMQFNDILRTNDIRETLVREGAEVVGGSPQQAAAYIRSEIPKWAKIVRDSGARAD